MSEPVFWDTPLMSLFQCHKRTMVLILSDCVALFGTLLVVAFIRKWAGGTINVEEHLALLLFLFIAPLLSYFEGLYSTPPPAMPEQLRILAMSTSVSYICITIFFFLGRGEMPSRLVFLGAWFLSLGTVPLLRWQVRRLCAKKSWWSVPCVLFGQNELAVRLEEYLDTHSSSGLRLAAMYTGQNCDTIAGCAPSATANASETSSLASEEKGLQSLITEHDLQRFLQRHPDGCAIVVISRCASLACRREITALASRFFSCVVLVPEEFADGEMPFWVRPLEIGTVFCFKVRQNLLDPRRLALKRIMDLAFSLTGGVVLLPFLGMIALGICIESRGSAFFRQRRIGRDGKPINILKFRTMVNNAEEVLATHLAANPELKKEWDADQKLRDDPRITRIGAFLRKTSLDELPQLWNVLCGEMSLVGPRPIVDDEIARYGEAFNAYIRVRPGITGLWQVSGRNDLSYSQRVHIDRYYISNWSTWLDILILARTIPVVLCRKGAY